MGNTSRFRVLALGAILCVLYFALPAAGQLEFESRQEKLSRSERQKRRAAGRKEDREAAKEEKTDPGALGRKGVQGKGGSGKLDARARRARAVARGGNRKFDGAKPTRGFRTSGDSLAKTASASSGPTTASSWFDSFTNLNPRWYFAGPWTNEGIFNNGWDTGYYLFRYSRLYLPIRKQTWVDPNNPSTVLPYTAGEIRTHNVEYGKTLTKQNRNLLRCNIAMLNSQSYSACMRPTRTSGIVSAFYTYAGGVWDTPTPPWPNASPVPHREIDIEFLVVNGVVKMQSNYFNNPGTTTPSEGHEQLHDLPGSSNSYRYFNSYSFKWHPDYIEWFQNGVSVRKVTHSAQTPIPQESNSVGRLMANAFTVNSLASGWAGTVPPNFVQDALTIKWIKYTKGTSCSVVPRCWSYY